MKIALINTIEPQPGSGDGMTDYTYNLYKHLSEKDEVTLVAPLKKSKRNDIFGLLRTFYTFNSKITNLAKQNYDIIHITNQEMGFAARILKKAGCKAKIVTTVHDLMRLKKGFNKGMLQIRYDSMVTSSVKDAFEYSDFIIFSGSTAQNDAQKMFNTSKNHKTIPLGPRESFRTEPIPEKAKSTLFTVGYVGAISYRKNVAFILKTARLLKDNPNYKFTIYGSGPEYDNLLNYKTSNGLNSVTFMGFAKEEELLKIYDSFDLFFYPTLEEGSSLPILDAQARGLPVVIYKDNNLDSEITRYCIVSNSENDAAETLERFRTEGYDSKLRAESIAYSRSFSWESITDNTKEVYSNLINANKS